MLCTCTIKMVKVFVIIVKGRQYNKERNTYEEAVVELILLTPTNTENEN